MKPNNILISFTPSSDGTLEIHGVAMADLEDAVKIMPNEAIYTQVGNILWRSPEAQTGIAVGKESDIWSFGVTVCPPTLNSVFALDIAFY